MAHDVFISYSNKDKPTADALCNALESEGFRCWIAPRDVPPGADWSSAIIRAIAECRLMVLVFSSHANASPHIQREVHRAFEKGLTVIPFRVEEIAPTDGLDYYMASVQWLDAFTPPLEVHLKNLAARVRALLDVPSIRPASPSATGEPRPSSPPEDRREARATSSGQPAAIAPDEAAPHHPRLSPRRLALSCSVVLCVGIFAFVLAAIYYRDAIWVAGKPVGPVADHTIQPDNAVIGLPPHPNPGPGGDVERPAPFEAVGISPSPPESIAKKGETKVEPGVPRRNEPVVPTTRHMAGDPEPSKVDPHGEVPDSAGHSEKFSLAREVHVPHMGIYYEPVAYSDGTFGARLTRDAAQDTAAGRILLGNGVSRLERGDTIVEMDGQRFRTAADVRNHRGNTTMKFINVRSGQISAASFSPP